MMPAREALEFLEGEIEDRITRFSNSAKFYSRGSLIQTVLTALLGAVTTFLIGVNQIDKATWITVLALLAAGGTTISAAWLGWFGFRRLQVGYQVALNVLRELRSAIGYAKAKYDGELPQADIDGYYDRYQQILNTLNHSWEAVRSSNAGG
jgi:hypothetical protein